MDIETVIADAKSGLDDVLRKVLPVAEQAASVVEDVRTLDVSALVSELESVIRSHLSSAGIGDSALTAVTANTEADPKADADGGTPADGSSS